ncbi:hypothetical protein ABZW18_34465 [Streptomyces sp. NPDC004647]
MALVVADALHPGGEQRVDAQRQRVRSGGSSAYACGRYRAG